MYFLIFLQNKDIHVLQKKKLYIFFCVMCYLYFFLFLFFLRMIGGKICILVNKFRGKIATKNLMLLNFLWNNRVTLQKCLQKYLRGQLMIVTKEIIEWRSKNVPRSI